MKPSDYLERAARLIERRGWIQGDFETKHGYCLMGALICLPERNRRHAEKIVGADVLPMAYQWVQRTINCRLTHFTTWNDEPTRTKAEVLSALRKAAASAKAAGQ